MPEIGKKNAKHIDIRVKSSDCIFNNNKDSCVFIVEILIQILVKK
jgi:hypothetical protein